MFLSKIKIMNQCMNQVALWINEIQCCLLKVASFMLDFRRYLENVSCCFSYLTWAWWLGRG